VRQCASKNAGSATSFGNQCLLQGARRNVAQQHRHLPDLHQLVGQPRVAARDLLGNEGEGLHLGGRVELDAAELLGHAERANADPVGLLEDLARQAGVRIHQPFALPVAAHEGDHQVVHETAAGFAHQPLFVG
jgi:hypothetical protein